MNNYKRAILYGLCLGDGHVSNRIRFKDGKYRYESASLMIGHSFKQYEYLKWKRDKVFSLLGGKKNKIAVFDHLVKGKFYKSCRFQRTHKYFRIIHKELYRGKRKYLSKNILNKLSPEALAIFYMDDGSMRANKNKEGNISSVSTEIALYVTEEECDNFINYIRDTYNITFKKAFDKRFPEIGYFVRLNTKESRKFISLIRKYMHESMLYKIDKLDYLD